MRMAIFACAIALLLPAAVLLYGQSGNGTIRGVVTDSSGAVIPGAQVTITQQQTSVAFRTKTNGVGIFIFPPVSLGPYRILVESPGMEGWQADLTLLAGQTVDLAPALKVGAAADTVTVTGDVAPLVTTTSGTLGNVLERERIDQLPLNGRNFTSLLSTIPGLEGNNSGANAFADGIRFGIEIQMDGALMQDRWTGQTFARPPGLDSISEMQATTNASSAKLARPGVVTISTRSGANQIHGSLFETARNNAVGLARARTDYYTEPPHLVRNEFGGSVGGPVWIPKIYNGKNRTFFFFNYEARRQMSASTTQIAVPTEAMRQGNFAGLIDAARQTYTVYDPFSTGPGPNYVRTPYPNQQIPVTQESPVAKFLFAQTPLPTMPGINPLAGYNWYGPAPSATREYTYTMRFDHHITDRDQVFVRYTRGIQGTDTANSNVAGSPETLDGAGNRQLAAERTNNGVVSYTHTFSPTFFAETLGTFMYDFTGKLAPSTANIDQQLGLPDPVGNPGIGWPFIQLAGSSSVNWMTYWGWPASKSISRVGTLDENFTKIKGRHELLFGGRFQQEALDYFNGAQYPAGLYTFNSNATSLLDPSSGSAYNPLPGTGNNTANLYIGAANTYQSQSWRNDEKTTAGERTLYFQDNIKVNPRLTINAGLRWEYFVPIKIADGGVVGWDQKTMAAVLGASPADFVRMGDAVPSVINSLTSQGMIFETNKQAGMPASMVHNYYKNFGPRLGFAYRLTGGNHPLVVRGGAALYTFPEHENGFLANYQYTMPTQGGFTLTENTAAQSPDGLQNYLLRHAPDIIAGVNSANVIDVNNPSSLSRGSQYFRVPALDEPTDRAWNWNLTLEKQIGQHTMLSAGYIGTHGYDLGQWVEYNNMPASSYVWYLATGTPTPTGTFANVAERPLFTPTGPGSVYGNIEVYQKVGWSNMNGIQLQAQHRFSNGLGFQVFYVLSDAMRAGGHGWQDEVLNSPSYFLPGAVPTDLHARDRLEWYSRDTEIPKHRVNYNWIYNLPVGRGKKVGNSMNRALDMVVGGWQLAGTGSMISTYFTLPTSNWGTFGKVQVYGTKYPIQDCRSGTCYAGYLWWNGFIPATQVNKTNAAGQCIGVCGIPSSYTPSNTPIYNDPTAPYYNTNTAFIKLNNGQTVSTQVNTGLNPWQNQYAPGPWTFGLNGSLWKAFPIRERVSLQFHADFFNVLNMPGMPAPGSDGTLSLRTSLNSPRNLQLSLRLIW